MDDGLLIEQVASFPQLYAKSDQRYKNIRIKENAWKTIAAILEDTTPEECEHRWKLLRNKYTALRREAKCTPSGSGATEITWPYYKVMSFLDPYLQTRRTFSNLSLKKKPECSDWNTLNTIIGEDSSQNSEAENSYLSQEKDGPTNSEGTIKRIFPREMRNDENDDGPSTPKVSKVLTEKRNPLIPRCTIPSKKGNDKLAEKMSGCFETFQKVLEGSTKRDESSNDDEQFVRSLVSDLRIFSQKQKIIIKKEIYNILAKYITDDSD